MNCESPPKEIPPHNKYWLGLWEEIKNWNPGLGSQTFEVLSFSIQYWEIQFYTIDYIQTYECDYIPICSSVKTSLKILIYDQNC